MSSSKRFGVLLTQAGEEELRVALSLYVRRCGFGSYLNCSSIDPNGALFHLVAEPCENLSSPSPSVDVLIPHHFIRMVVSSPERNPMGFLVEAAGSAGESES